MAELIAGIPLQAMNTSTTINATAAWLLGLYVAHATDTGVDSDQLTGTTQNDIVKEYLSRGTYIFGPEASRRLTVGTIAWAAHHAPRWNPINVCDCHLQAAGATPVQELAYALATAVGVPDAAQASGQVPTAKFRSVVGRISFFVNAGIRFVEETCKMRVHPALGQHLPTPLWRRRPHPGPLPLRRPGQLPRLDRGQPENNVERIVLPEQIAAAARDEDVDVVGLSKLSGSHLTLVPAVMSALAAAGVSVPMVVGGIIPTADAGALKAAGVAAVYTPKDFQLTRIMADMVE